MPDRAGETWTRRGGAGSGCPQLARASASSGDEGSPPQYERNLGPRTQLRDHIDRPRGRRSGRLDHLEQGGRSVRVEDDCGAVDWDRPSTTRGQLPPNPFGDLCRQGPRRPAEKVPRIRGTASSIRSADNPSTPKAMPAHSPAVPPSLLASYRTSPAGLGLRVCLTAGVANVVVESAAGLTDTMRNAGLVSERPDESCFTDAHGAYGLPRRTLDTAPEASRTCWPGPAARRRLTARPSGRRVPRCAQPSHPSCVEPRQVSPTHFNTSEHRH
jgi:hypothetical protein